MKRIIIGLVTLLLIFSMVACLPNTEENPHANQVSIASEADFKKFVTEGTDKEGYLTDDIELTNPISIPSGLIKTVDLNEKTVATNSKITNNGEVTFKNGSIICGDEDTYFNMNILFENKKKLTMENVKVKFYSDTTSESSSAFWNSNKLTLTNCEILCTTKTSRAIAIGSYKNDGKQNSVATIKNTPISAVSSEGEAYAIYSSDGGKVTIEGQKIISKGKNDTIGAYVSNNSWLKLRNITVKVENTNKTDKTKNVYGVRALDGGTLQASGTLNVNIVASRNAGLGNDNLYGIYITKGTGETWNTSELELEENVNINYTIKNGQETVAGQNYKNN